MKSIRHLLSFSAAFALSIILAGCQSPPPSQPTAPVAESSVKPGINGEYLRPSLNVTQWVERFEKEGREIYEQRQQIVDAIKLRRGASIGDIGAGTGLFTPMFAQAVGPKGTVYAVDIAKDFLAHIEQRASAAGLHNVKTVLCTERSAELPANSIDVAFICDTYHHFEYPQSTMSSIHRALRRGGELIVIDFVRVPGKSSDFILKHTRAGQEVFTAEIEAAGFKQVEQIDLLKENYMLRFRKVAK
jgi:predicted methyltransferase